MTTNPELNDKDFLHQFNNCTLPISAFDHKGHLRLAWLVLNQHPLEESIKKVCNGIRSYAMHVGVPHKFSYTITAAVMVIMKERLDSQEVSSSTTFECFLENNQDLVQNLILVLSQYYSQERIQSKQAAQSWVKPDLKPLPILINAA